MCDTADDGVGIANSIPRELQLRNQGLRSADISPLMLFARTLANSRENCDSHIGFVGYRSACGTADKV
jgi:hypothetical protein